MYCVVISVKSYFSCYENNAEVRTLSKIAFLFLETVHYNLIFIKIERLRFCCLQASDISFTCSLTRFLLSY